MISQKLSIIQPQFLDKVTSNGFVLFLLIGFHIGLGVMNTSVYLLSTYVAYATIGITFVLAFLSNRNLMYAAAYVSGAEIYWRMTQADIFWESGKYTIAFAFLIALSSRKSIKIPPFSFLFFIALIPAFLGIGSNFSISTLRDQVSFYGSGPATLFIASVYFFQIKLNRQDLVKMLFAYILPLLTIATYALLGILSTDVVWVDASNFSASGGFGPNQVSTVLGLGMLSTVFLVLLTEIPKHQKIVIALIGLWLTIQTLFTFSRGGFYAAVASGVVFGVLLFRKSPRLLLPILFWSTLFFGILMYLIIPQLDKTTDNQLSGRLQDTSSTGRIEVATAEIQAFIDNPLGGGAGSANAIRGKSIQHSSLASHNEYTRLLAEHGILGFFALLCLMGGLYVNFRNFEHSLIIQAIMGALITWALLTLGHSAFRIAAPAYAIGLTFASYEDREEVTEAD
ncbi:MAG: O-antigen ligase family protein [Anaerolineales bacterium]|nr:O-antigen ligase family protein [Anaerolineales bacterium]